MPRAVVACLRLLRGSRVPRSQSCTAGRGAAAARRGTSNQSSEAALGKALETLGAVPDSGWSDQNPTAGKKHATWPNKMLELGPGFVIERFWQQDEAMHFAALLPVVQTTVNFSTMPPLRAAKSTLCFEICYCYHSTIVLHLYTQDRPPYNSPSGSHYTKVIIYTAVTAA
jgi:hypothetical protein